ncbi:MAG: hypothetical protein AAF748_04980 [Pseudomonadota bacterium]
MARWRLVEQWLETTLATRDVWFAPLAAIADHLDSVTSPRTDTLPYYSGPQR